MSRVRPGPTLAGAWEIAEQFVRRLDQGATPEELSALYQPLPPARQRLVADRVVDLLAERNTTRADVVAAAE